MYLSIDTFSEILGIAIFNQNYLVTLQEYYRQKPFSEFLAPKLKSIFNELSIKKEDLKGVIVNKGPGSYTGIRVGITVAKTLSYSLDIPIYAYTTHDAIAYSYRFFRGKIYVALNAGKGEAYVCEYLSDKFKISRITDIKLTKIDELRFEESEETLIVYKNLSLNQKNALELKNSTAYSGGILALEKNLLEDRFKIEPLYIRGL